MISTKSIAFSKEKLKNLSSLNIDMNGLDDNSKIYIRPSQCPYYKNLGYNCRLLKKNGKIAYVITNDDGTLKIKTLDEKFVEITHESDLRELFQDFDKFSFK